MIIIIGVKDKFNVAYVSSYKWRKSFLGVNKGVVILNTANKSTSSSNLSLQIINSVFQSTFKKYFNYKYKYSA